MVGQKDKSILDSPSYAYEEAEKLVQSYPGIRLEDLGRNHLEMYQVADSFRFGEEQVVFCHWLKTRIKHSQIVRSENQSKPLQLLDLGAGSGILMLLLSALLPNSEGVGVELMHRPSQILRANLWHNGLSERFTVVEENIKSLLEKKRKDRPFTNGFDIVVMNPPYFLPGTGPSRVHTTEGEREVMAAREEVHASLEDFFQLAAESLEQDGKVFLLNRPNRLQDAIIAAAKAGLRATCLKAVVPHIGQKPSVFLMQFEKRKKKDFSWQEDLVLRNSDGTYTLEVEEYYR